VLLIDAGGGTVDLITFTIEQLSPTLKLREAAAGIGAYCGSTYLNRRFEDFLRERLENCPYWDRDTLEQAMMRFEACAKRRVILPTISFSQFPEFLTTKIFTFDGACFVFSGEEMRDIFILVLDMIVQLALQQFRSSKSPVKTVLIVGGFGQNQFLRRYLRDNVLSSATVLSPPGGWTAVVRGALAKLLSNLSSLAPQISIGTRIARKYYGFKENVPFNPFVHDESRK
jgi:hypothetical protein